MAAILDTQQPVAFDEPAFPKTRPRLGAAKDFNLSSKQVARIFGINEADFVPIPARMAVPILSGQRQQNDAYHVLGWLYLLEPQEWTPVVRHGNTITASEFETPQSATRKAISEAKFNLGCKASVAIGRGGSYYDVTVDVKQSNDVAFEYSSTSATEKMLRRARVDVDELVQELVLYPTLRCKALRKQRIDFTVHETDKKLDWRGRTAHQERIRVPSSRLGPIEQLQLDPVPVQGPEREDATRLLPVFQLGLSGDVEVATLLSRKDWPDWYVYEAGFEECSEIVDLAAPQNDVAFKPTSCWTVHLNDDDNPYESSSAKGWSLLGWNRWWKWNTLGWKRLWGDRGKSKDGNQIRRDEAKIECVMEPFHNT